jgi:ribonuclease P protein component
MLPSAHRLTRSTDFLATTRRGTKVSRPCVVVHVMPAPSSRVDPFPTRIGFTVGKGVGGSVIRHAVARRLRWQARSLLTLLPDGCTVVVRALPKAASAPSARLGDELRSAFASAAAKMPK